MVMGIKRCPFVCRLNDIGKRLEKNGLVTGFLPGIESDVPIMDMAAPDAGRRHETGGLHDPETAQDRPVSGLRYMSLNTRIRGIMRESMLTVL